MAGKQTNNRSLARTLLTLLTAGALLLVAIPNVAALETRVIDSEGDDCERGRKNAFHDCYECETHDNHEVCESDSKMWGGDTYRCERWKNDDGEWGEWSCWYVDKYSAEFVNAVQ